MIPGMNMKKAEKMMRKMGIQQVEIDATQVIIKCEDKELIINNPQVSKVNMMGQNTYQVVGEAEEHTLTTEPDISEEDIKTVMEQTGKDEETVKNKIKENNGDLAKTIMDLKDTSQESN